LPLSGKIKISVVVVKKRRYKEKTSLRNTAKKVVGKKRRLISKKRRLIGKKRRCNCKATPEFVSKTKKRLGAKIIAPGSKKQFL